MRPISISDRQTGKQKPGKNQAMATSIPKTNAWPMNLPAVNASNFFDHSPILGMAPSRFLINSKFG
jgi:hypothetical protein